MYKILIVEDDNLLALALSKKFQTEGYEVEIAVDGKDGIEKARKIIPDVVLLDILMPKMTGIEVYKTLSMDPSLKGTKIVVITNLSDPQTREELRGLGVKEFIIKTDYTASEVVELVNKLLKG